MNRLVCLLLLFLSFSGYSQEITTEIREPKVPRTYTLRLDTLSGTLFYKPFGSLRNEQELSTTANYSLAQARALGTAQAVFNLKDALRGGVFYFDNTDTSTPDDGALCIVDASGHRYKRLLPDRIITPQMFGAIPNDGADDYAALKAWIQTKAYQHYAPAGVYISSDSLLRLNKGFLTLRGAGQGATIFEFSGNSSGFHISNTIGTGANYGTVTVQDLEIRSTGTKTGTKEALYVNTQHEQNPGYNIHDIAIKCTTVGQEWSAGIHEHDCSEGSISTVDMWGASRTRFEMIVFSHSQINDTTSRPSVEHNISHFTGRTAKTAIKSITTGFPGLEGIKVIDANIYNIFQGWYATSTYGSSDFKATGLHLNVVGGKAIDFSGIQQVSIRDGNFIINKDYSTGVVPSSGVYINNGSFVGLDIFIQTIDSTANAVEFAGSGGGINIFVDHVCYAGLTNTIKYSSGYTLPTVRGGGRTWNAALGTNTGSFISSSSPPTRNPVYTSATGSFASGPNLLQGDPTTGLYLPVSPVVATAHSQTFVTTSSATIDPSQVDYVRIFNSSTAITLTIDVSKFTKPGQQLIFNRAEVSSGIVTLTTTNSGVNKIQGVGSITYYSTYTMPLSTVQSSVVLVWNGTHLEQVGTVKGLSTGGAYVSASTTITPNTTFFIIRLGTSGATTVTLDYTASADNSFVYFEFEEGATGTVTVTTTDATNHKIQKANRANDTSDTVPTAGATWAYNGTNYMRIN